MAKEVKETWLVSKYLPPKYDEKGAKAQEEAFISALAAAMNSKGYLQTVIKSQLDSLAKLKKTANDYSRKNLGTLEETIWNAVAAGAKGPKY